MTGRLAAPRIRLVSVAATCSLAALIALVPPASASETPDQSNATAIAGAADMDVDANVYPYWAAS